jgi:hypothetical protein
METMSVQPSAKQPPETEIALRRFLNRPEAATLLGMILTVVSLFLVWESVKISDLPGVPASLPAEFVSQITHEGRSLPAIFWPLLISATLSSMTLLWTPNAQTRLPFFVIQLALGLTCFVISLSHFAPLPGIFVALTGSALLLFGAVDRFMLLSAPKHTDE